MRKEEGVQAEQTWIIRSRGGKEHTSWVQSQEKVLEKTPFVTELRPRAVDWLWGRNEKGCKVVGFS